MSAERTPVLPRYAWYYNGDAPDVVAEPVGEWVKAADLASYFTQEDVKRLEYAATVIECESATDPAIAGLRDFAARIAALLPSP